MLNMSLMRCKLKNVHPILVFTVFIVCILDRQASANSVDQDETLHNEVSHQGLHCLPLNQQFLDNIRK